MLRYSVSKSNCSFVRSFTHSSINQFSFLFYLFISKNCLLTQNFDNLSKVEWIFKELPWYCWQKQRMSLSSLSLLLYFTLSSSSLSLSLSPSLSLSHARTLSLSSFFLSLSLSLSVWYWRNLSGINFHKPLHCSEFNLFSVYILNFCLSMLNIKIMNISPI